jgi:RimJ/RimL family protein N-acetyltransferase
MASLAGDPVELVALDPENETHVAAYARSRNEPAMRATGYHGDGPLTAERAREWIAERQDADTNALCAVRVGRDDENGSEDGGEVVGWAGTHLRDERSRVAGFGYYVLPESQGNGYASEAARPLTAFAFGELNTHSIRTSVQADNPASVRVLERLGFREEGRRRDDFYKDGAYVDVLTYGLLADEFDPEE